MSTLRTARERARAEVEAEILRVGRQQLAERGAAALSVRAVARELGMVSSAIYRYVDSRDDLLTRLIDDAYNSLGAAVERDVESSVGLRPVDRWIGAATALRGWALERPHEYALLYGAPVPGYVAPERTSVSGTRASRALVAIVRDAQRDGELHRPPSDAAAAVDADLSEDFEALRDDLVLDVDDETLLDVLVAWTQLFGLVSFETFGQTRGVVDHHVALFESATRRTAALIGLS